MSGDKILWTINTDQISDKEISKLIVTVNLPLWPGNVIVLGVQLTFIECFLAFCPYFLKNFQEPHIFPKNLDLSNNHFFF